MVAGGAGITLLPTLALDVENRRGELRTRRFARPVPTRTLVLAWRKSSPTGAALRELGAAMRAAYRARRR
jgi:LysR family hydrogen peroxide-inducible transcriptional activator